MNLSDLDFHLPLELIAQTPSADRSSARLLHYRRDSRTIARRTFAELPSLLRAGDLLVLNDTRVAPVRFALRKPSGGIVEGLLLRPNPHRGAAGLFVALLRNLGAVRPEVRLTFVDAPEAGAYVLEKTPGDEYVIRVDDPGETVWQLLSRVGRMPLPPYIRRDKLHDDRDALDRERYQTVFARSAAEGDASVAAPTAGLHFTGDLLRRLDEAGVERTFLTLQVGQGTFKPVTADRVEDHVMHEEQYEIPPAAADALNRAKRSDRRIVAVGTTSARVLESQPANRPFEPKRDATRIFIYPPYDWKHVGALITNFHLPRSTLIALVAAMVGLEEQRRIYGEAIEQKYRFFSYGDAMLIE